MSFSLGPGLTAQLGPFKTSKKDYPKVSKQFWKGGGVPAGGQQHAGHGNWMQVMNPQAYPMKFPAPPLPTASRYATVLSVHDVYKSGRTSRAAPMKFQQPQPPVGLAMPPVGMQKPGQTRSVQTEAGEQNNEAGIMEDAVTEYSSPIATGYPLQMPETPMSIDSPVTPDIAGDSVVYGHTGAAALDAPDLIANEQRYQGVGIQTDPVGMQNAKWESKLEQLTNSLSEDNERLGKQLQTLETKNLSLESIEARNQKAMRTILQHFNLSNIPEYINPAEFESLVVGITKVTPLLIQEREALENFARNFREYGVEEERQYKEYLDLKAEVQGIVPGQRKRKRTLADQAMDTARIERHDRLDSASIATADAPIQNPILKNEVTRKRAERMDFKTYPPTGYSSSRYAEGKPKKTEMQNEYPFPTRSSRREGITGYV